jgi:chemotaxis protein methyltransferase CheR
MTNEKAGYPVNEAWLPAFIEVISRRFGHHVPDRRVSTVRRAVIDAYVASGEGSLDAYRDRLADMPLDSPCVAELVSRLTVKESYFFRDEFTTATLREVVLPRLVERARKRKELSIWSAGCSCGEEPYTVAILVHELLGPSPGFDVRIVGTDVDASALRAAAAAHYAEWSVRTLPAAVRQKYFEVRGSRFALRDQYKKWVRFEAHNLADASSKVPEPGTFDLVLCRNVGIYLSDDALEALYGKLASALSPDGLVVTAPSDPRANESSGLCPVLIRSSGHATVAYAQRGSTWESSAERPRNDAGDPEATPTIPAGPPSMPPSSAPIPAAPPSPRIAVAASAADARADEAVRNESSPPSLSTVNAAIARAPLKAAPYLSRALLEIERNEHLKAERTLAKVLYLAPDLAEAHYRMGLLLARRGSLSAARRSFMNALQAATSSGEEALRWVSLVGAELARLERR